MGFSMRYEDSDKLEAYLGSIETDCEKAGETVRKEGSKIIKAKAIGELNRLRSKNNKAGHTHMADDVIISTRKDKWGDSITRIQGGKKTGTLWHLVNDGTYNANATHFMDKTIKSAESELNSMVDKAVEKIGD